MSTLQNLPKTRKEAIEIDSEFYFTNSPCKNGHVDRRKTSNHQCCTCIIYNSAKYNQQYTEEGRYKQYYKQYRQTESHSQVHRKYRHSIKGRETHNLYRQRDYVKEKDRKYSTYWYSTKKGQEQIRKYTQSPEGKAVLRRLRQKRRARILHAIPHWFEKDRVNKIYEMCIKLSDDWNIKFEVDHYYPLQGKDVCGLHCWENLQLLARDLNNSKNNKNPESNK